MLLACQNCHRLYDIGDLAAGRLVRCACGTLTPVPRRRARAREMAHCGNCGAELGAKKRCEHCEARVTLADEGLGEPCPECFVRLPGKARFCPGCGTRLRAAGAVQALTKGECPRCDEPLSVVEGKQDPFHQCTGCGGIWLSRGALERFVERAQARPASAGERRAAVNTVRLRKKSTRGHKLIACPVCRVRMQLLEFAGYSGVLVDRCLLHGWWFDGGELEVLEPFVGGGGLEEAARRRRARHLSRRKLQSWRRTCIRDGGRGTWSEARKRTRMRGDFLDFLAGLVE